MKRAFQLPLTQAILNAQPSQRQVDRVAAPLRRRGAWSQFVEQRLPALADPEQTSAEAPTTSAGLPAASVGDGPGSASSTPLHESHPAPSLKQRLELIVRQQNSDGGPPSAPKRQTRGKTSKAQPDPGPAGMRLEPRLTTNDFSKAVHSSRHKPAPSGPPARPASPQKPAFSVSPSKPGKREDAQFGPVAGPLPGSKRPLSPPGKTTPSPQQSATRTKSAGAKVAAQARETMILELIAEHADPRPPLRTTAAESRARRLTRLIAPVLMVAAFATGILLRERLAFLPGEAAQIVSRWKERILPPPPQSEPQLVLAKAIPLRRSPIEVMPTTQPARSLPTTYGIFASSGGRLIRLEPLNIRLPDSRIALPGLITKPATVVLPNGQLSFVAYQRELITSAPDSAQLRVVAKVARALSFSAAGKPIVTAVDDTWAIRSVSIDLTVAPVPESREMVDLRPASPDVTLSPGRYLLVFKNQTYDFVVAGKATDKAHCLEKAETEDGEMFSECRKLP